MNGPSCGNNRYNSDFEDEEEEVIDEGEGGLEVAEENHVS